MTIGVHQPYFFPYLPYFQLIKAVDKFICLDDVNYINKGYINRNVIKSGRFTIPIQAVSQNKLINELHIVPAMRGEFFNKIVHDYTGSPYFTTVWLMLERVLCSGETNIAKINYMAIKEVCAYLDIQTQIVPSSSVYPKNAPGQYRILEICKQERATRYINAIGGKELYSQKVFGSVELKFLHAKINSLSIIDLMMILPANEIKPLLNEYELE